MFIDVENPEPPDCPPLIVYVIDEIILLEIS